MILTFQTDDKSKFGIFLKKLILEGFKEDLHDKGIGFCFFRYTEEPLSFFHEPEDGFEFFTFYFPPDKGSGKYFASWVKQAIKTQPALKERIWKTSRAIREKAIQKETDGRVAEALYFHNVSDPLKGLS